MIAYFVLKLIPSKIKFYLKNFQLKKINHIKILDMIWNNKLI